MRQTVWHPQTKTLKDAADAAIKSAIYMLNRRSCWDALHEIQRVVDISRDIGALPALAISIVLDAWCLQWFSQPQLPSSREQANNSFDVIGAALVEPLDSD